MLASRLPLKDMYSIMDVVFARYFGNLDMFVISFRSCGLDSSFHIKKIMLGYFVLSFYQALLLGQICWMSNLLVLWSGFFTRIKILHRIKKTMLGFVDACMNIFKSRRSFQNLNGRNVED